MKLLHFDDEAGMRTMLRSFPQCEFGAVEVRGGLGMPGVYVDSGTTDAEGGIVWTEVTPPQPFPGYFVAVDWEVIPPDLAANEFVPPTGFSGLQMVQAVGNP